MIKENINLGIKINGQKNKYAAFCRWHSFNWWKQRRSGSTNWNFGWNIEKGVGNENKCEENKSNGIVK